MSYRGKPLRPLLMAVDNAVMRLLPPQVGRFSYILRNTGATDIYISSVNDVSATTGFPVKAGETVQFRKVDLDDTESEVFAISPAGAGTMVVVS